MPSLCVVWIAAAAALARDPEALAILGPDYPRVFHFRATEAACNPRAYPTYESWEQSFSGLMGIMGKCLEEECLGREPRNPEFFSRFKQRQPAQAVLLHFNGNSRDPLYRRERYFPGHWIYRQAVAILEDIRVESGESVIRVADAHAFRVNTGRYQTSTDDIGLFGVRDGRHDWYHNEEVQLVAVDTEASTITVRRGCYGTVPRAFTAGEARAAAHEVEGPWGAQNNLLWFYNYATHCPRDRDGRTCADALIDDLSAWFGQGGKLAAFDGIEFDVLHHLTSGDTDGDGEVDNGTLDGSNHYGIGVVEFIRGLRARLGADVIIQADGALGPGGVRSQRAWGLLNGIESEGWPNLSDWEIAGWSSGLNRHGFWQQNAHPPAFSYINHKWIEGIAGKPGETRAVAVPFSRHRLVFAAAQFCDAMLCASSPPPLPAAARRSGPHPVWDEFVQGADHRLGWLGRPEGPAVHVAARTPDVLAGEGRGEALARRIGGQVTSAVTAAGVVVRPQSPAAKDITFTLRNVPAAGPDLFVMATLSAAPMAARPVEMARFARVLVSGGTIDLLAAPPDDTGQCLRGKSEEALDRSTGAVVVSGPRTVGGKTLPAVFVHPPWRHGTGYTFWIREADVPAAAELRFAFGMGERSPERSDGVWFQILAATVGVAGAGEFTPLFTATTKAHEWLDQAVSLAAYAGQRLRLKFIADAGPADDATTDHAHWGHLRIVPIGADESAVTPAAEQVTWLNAKPFTAGFYYHHVRTAAVDLTFIVESAEPVTIHSLALHAHPDAMYRVFEKGLILANPSRVPYTVDLQAISPGRSYRRLLATQGQDRIANDGQAVGDTVTLGERDALFLLRTE